MVLLITPIYYIIDHVILHYVTLNGDLMGIFTGLPGKKRQQTGNLCSKVKTSRQRNPRNCISGEKHISAAKS